MIRIAVCDDESLVASSLGTLLDLQDDLEVATVVGSGEELLAWWQRNDPVDVVVMDVNLGGIDGVITAERLGGANVVMITSHPRPTVLKRALAAGVRGFVPKTSSADEFAAAIRAVYEGKRYIDADLAAAAISTADSPLTAREAEVLEASGTGRPVEEIAASVHLAVGTTRNYLSSAMSKVGAANRFEAYMRARELGWL